MRNGNVDSEGRSMDEPTVGPQHSYRHGQDLDIRCRQCGTSWRWAPDVPTQCPDCVDHLGEPLGATTTTEEAQR